MARKSVANSADNSVANSAEKEYIPGGVTGKGWVKGQSGNPNGRPKTPEDVKELLDGIGAEAVQAQIDIMRKPDTPDKLRYLIAQSLADRALGKATEYKESTVDATISVTMDNDADEFAG